VFEHRAVMYDRLGAGPLPCFWCGISLAWGKVVIDHLNEVKDDNRPENLVVSCNNCNRARGAMIPFIRTMRPAAFEVFVAALTGLLCVTCHNRKTATTDGGFGRPPATGS
jgi:5-methylcytosine-specific restriction endonuclease McrA